MNKNNHCANNNQRIAANRIKIALVGSPNVGKSTIFNALCGLSQHVGNWPGKTIEKKIGMAKIEGITVEIIDLPGIYSLSTNSIEEQITRNYIVEEKPDLVINIVDASNLERNLLLTAELIELTPKVILVLNMMDIATTEGYEIDVNKFEKQIGIRVIPIIATKKSSIDSLVKNILFAINGQIPKPILVDYAEIEKHIEMIVDKIADHPPFSPRFTAIKALESDEYVIKHLQAENIKIPYGYTEKIKQKRHNHIHKIISTITIKRRESQNITDKIDNIVLSPIFGFPLLIIILFALFYLTFTFSSIFQNLIELFFSSISIAFRNLLDGLPLFISSLLIDGILAGLGAVFSFLPLLIIFFLLFSLLEDAGYLPRVAIILDRFMGFMGLPGKAFFSVLMGYGCNIAGVMACRILDRDEDRILTVILNPIIPCSARLGVMAIITSAFFGKYAPLVLTFLIIINLILMAIVGFILKNIFFKKMSNFMVMELPLYHVPHLKTIFLFSLDRIKSFLYRAGTTILILSILIWLLSSFPSNLPLADTYLGKIGSIFMPITRLMGFNQELTTSLLTGIVAKESVISTLAILYNSGEESLMQLLIMNISPLVAFVYLLVTMLYVPCIATIASIYRETGSFKWTIIAIMYNLGLATLLGISTYQFGRLLGF